MDSHHHMSPELNTSADVIILGAGISGLACATHLRRAGLRVVVLEARQRPGGRLHTISLSGGPGCPSYAVDLGAAWVHGIGSAGAPNHLYRMACELQLGCRATDYNDAAVYTADGRRLPDSAVADIERLYHGFEQHLQSLLHSRDPRVALMPIQTALDAFAASRGLSSAQSAQLAFAVSNHMEHYWAGEVRNMGVAALDEVVLPGGDVVLTEGYGGMVASLAAGLDMRLGHEVVALQYGDGSGVAVTARVVDGSGGSDRVVTLTAAAAVVTLPLGVLRSGAVEFLPPLAAVDPPKAAAIGQLGVAVYNKVVMLFDPIDVFWDDHAFIYRIPAAWEAGRWSYFLNMNKVAGVPILVAFNLGESAVQLEGISDKAAVEGALVALAGMYGTERVRRPRNAVVTRWGNDPHSRMSYTYVPAGLTTTSFDDLARPVMGRLFFAGEASHRRHYGTAHGAYESGVLAAAAILQQRQLDASRRAQPLQKWPVGHLASTTPARVVRPQPRPSRWRAMLQTHGSRRGWEGGDGAATATSGAISLAPTGGVQPPPPELVRNDAAVAVARCSADLDGSGGDGNNRSSGATVARSKAVEAGARGDECAGAAAKAAEAEAEAALLRGPRGIPSLGPPAGGAAGLTDGLRSKL